MRSIDELEKEIWQQIALATQKRDSAKIAFLNALAQDSEKLKKEMERIERALVEPQSPSPTPTPDGKSVVFEITEGALNQNYLSLTKIKKHNLIPKDGKEFEVETSAGFSFRSWITSNMLSERGKTRQFYEAVEMKPGDKVIWREIGPYRYHLAKWKE